MGQWLQRISFTLKVVGSNPDVFFFSYSFFSCFIRSQFFQLANVFAWSQLLFCFFGKHAFLLSSFIFPLHLAKSCYSLQCIYL